MEKLTYEQLEREALKLKIQLEKTIDLLATMQKCNSFELRATSMLNNWDNIVRNGRKMISETPIKL